MRMVGAISHNGGYGMPAEAGTLRLCSPLRRCCDALSMASLRRPRVSSDRISAKADQDQRRAGVRSGMIAQRVKETVVGPATRSISTQGCYASDSKVIVSGT